MRSLSKLEKILGDHKNFLLICHERPDGDSVGSLLALGEILENMDKEVRLVSKDPVPEVFKFLSGSEKIKNDFSLDNFEAVILLDNGDFHRTGFPERLCSINQESIHLINIDHHPKNDLWRTARVNFVDVEVSSTCELIYKMVSRLNLEISSSIATALLTGIFTDTGGFQHSNTSEEVLGAASALLNRGAKLRQISANIANSRSVEMLKLWGIALNRLIFDCGIGLAYSILTLEDIENAGATENEVSGLVNLINAIPESRVALLLYETSDGRVKGSLRTETDNIDMSKLAEILGGGGHKKASGFSLVGQFDCKNGIWQII